MKDWIKPVISGIIGGLLGGMLGLIILAMVYNNSDVYGNVADWVSGIGSIAAIFMIFWQVQKDISTNKETNFSISRPLFTINYSDDIDFSGGDVVYRADNQPNKFFCEKYRMFGIAITNISIKPIIALEAHVKYVSDVSDYIYKINQVKSGDKVLLEIGLLDIHSVYCYGEKKNIGQYDADIEKENEIQNNLELEKYKIDKVVVYCTTEIREKMKLTFKMNDSEKRLEYSEKHLENRKGPIDVNEYGLDGFIESSSYIIKKK